MGQDGCVGIPWEQPPLCDPIEQAFVSMLTQPRRLRLGIRLRRGPIVEIDLRQVYTLKSKHGVEVNTISCEVWKNRPPVGRGREERSDEEQAIMGEALEGDRDVVVGDL